MNSKPTSKRIINAIAKNPNGDIIYVEPLIYDKKGVTSIEAVLDRLKQRLKWPETIMPGYGRDTQQSLLVYEAQRKNGKIDWSLDFNRIPLPDVFRATNGSPITVIGICFEVEVGLGAGIGETLNYIEVLKLLLFVFFAAYSYIYPFRVLSRKYGVDADYIRDTIYRSRNWGLGFISAENFRYKKIVECAIMKKMGYKKLDKQWVLMTGNLSKAPHILFKEG